LQQQGLQAQPEAAHAAAFLEVNRALHGAKIDDSLSGTTAVTALLRGAQLLVANVGDSRAFLAEDTGRAVAAVNLSCDQTPFRADECQRVRRAGARVLTLDQIEGHKSKAVDCWGADEDEDGGDPPRLWVPGGMYPGTAFTRSLGDAVAERIGVIADPELQTVTLTEASRFAVVATDGVFEFLPSQAVADIVVRAADPLQAALAVVAESYRAWLQYETRTDDITIIVLQFEGLPEALAAAASATSPPTPQSFEPPPSPPRSPRTLPPQLAAASPRTLSRPSTPFSRSLSAGGNEPRPSLDGGRPVRRTQSRDRRAITASLSAAPAGAEADEVAGEPLSSSERAALDASLRSCILFVSLTDAQREALLGSFRTREVAAGSPVFRTGDRSLAFFVVARGEFHVHLGEEGPPAKPHLAYAVQGGIHPSFGELGVLYNCARSASVFCAPHGGGGALWALSRAAFASAVRAPPGRPLLQQLRAVPLLQSLTAGQLQRLADGLVEVSHEAGEVIISAGETCPQGSFYIVTAGMVECTEPSSAGDASRGVVRLGPGDSFGERALLSSSATRTRTCVALQPTTCLRCTRALFEELLGPPHFILNADARWRERAARQGASTAALPSSARLRALGPGQLARPPRRLLWTCDVGRVALCALSGAAPPGEPLLVTVRQISVTRAAALGRQASVMRERQLAGLISPMPFIPALMASFEERGWLHCVLQTRASTSLAAALAAPLSERAAAFYAAEAALALEHIHWHGAVFRGLCAETALLDSEGHLQLVDFRFAKLLLSGRSAAAANAAEASSHCHGRTFTLCGAADYLAPEAVAGTGHDEAVDWWALGCFAHYLLTLRTPFEQSNAAARPASEEEAQLELFGRIGRRQLALPPQLSPAAQRLLSQLLAHEPGARARGASLGEHAWFAECGVSLEALGGGKLPAAPEEALAQLGVALRVGLPTGEEEEEPPRVSASGVPAAGEAWWAGY